MITLKLKKTDYLNLELAIEGAIEEFEVLMRDVEWFTTETADQLRDCLTVIQGQANAQV